MNEGYSDAYIRKNEDECTPVEIIIRGAQHARVDWTRARVCTFRNNLNKVLLTPRSLDNAWIVDACYFNGTLFLDIVKTGVTYGQMDLFTYYGYKFEALCTGSSLVDATSEFALLLKVKLGAHDILMAAEVDCAEATTSGQTPSSAPKYLELKTYKIPPKKHHANMVRQKYPRWWVQSFLAGVPTLVLGGRDNRGILQEVKTLSVTSLPSDSRAVGQPWDAFQLLRFGEDMLSWMQAQGMQAPGHHLRFSYDPKTRRVACSDVPDGTLPNRLVHVFDVAAPIQGPASSALAAEQPLAGTPGAGPRGQQAPEAGSASSLAAASEQPPITQALARAAAAAGAQGISLSSKEQVGKVGLGSHEQQADAVGQVPGGSDEELVGEDVAGGHSKRQRMDISTPLMAVRK